MVVGGWCVCWVCVGQGRRSHLPTCVSCDLTLTSYLEPLEVLSCQQPRLIYESCMIHGQPARVQPPPSQQSTHERHYLRRTFSIRDRDNVRWAVDHADRDGPQPSKCAGGKCPKANLDQPRPSAKLHMYRTAMRMRPERRSSCSACCGSIGAERIFPTVADVQKPILVLVLEVDVAHQCARWRKPARTQGSVRLSCERTEMLP